jgi:amino acid transporter
MTESTTAGGGYKQELHRELSVLGNVVIVLSGVTPASSVFIIVPFIIITAGTGSFLALLFAAIIGVFMAFCWAELGAAFPITGGDYALVWHAFKGPWAMLGSALSFATFALMVSTALFIPAVIALGTGEYLKSIVTLDPRIAGAVVVALASAIAILRIRTNAWVTGVFLALELLALLTLTVLGLANFHADRVSSLFVDWQLGSESGLSPISLGVIFTATATGIFAYNGYASAVNYSEETRGSSRGIATAIIWALIVTVAAELIPTTAVILGAPDIAKLTTDAAPMTYFLLATSNETVNTLVSLGIAIAIFNACIAIALAYGRILYSSSRDRAWPGFINNWMGTISPRFHSPWVATALVGVLGVIFCLGVDLNTLITLTGASLVANYALIAIAALLGRITGATDQSPYRMPWWPLPPILALAATAYVATQQTETALLVTGATILIGLIYWAIFILPQGNRRWNLREPLHDEMAEETAAAAGPA